MKHNTLILIEGFILINTELFKIAESTVEYLKENRLTVATAESCTGGMVSSFITSVSGVSQVFEMGITSYTCEIKNKILGVRGETLEKYGAVSEQTAREMAENARKMANTDMGASVTGVAGPDGSEGHNPGYVFIAVAGEKGTVVKLLDIEPKSRNFVREKATEALLNLIKSYAKELKND